MGWTQRRHDLSAILQAALGRVDPYQMLLDHVRLDGDILCIDLAACPQRLDLSGYRRIVAIGAGKATAPMALALERILGERLNGGVIAVKYGHTEPLQRIEIIEAGHPVPDENGLEAARRIMAIAAESDEQTLVISLISGGGSALLPLPARAVIGGEELVLTLDDKQKTTGLLLACGADIEEINCIRKHLSMIKGGHLLSQLAPARSINFILSDVVGDSLSSIASGLTCADPTSFADALEIMRKYDITERVPVIVRRFLEAGRRGQVAETLKQGSPELALTANVLLGTNLQALEAAAAEAQRRGYRPVRLTSRIVGEAREVAKVLAAIALDCAAGSILADPPVCLLSGGEPVVQIRGGGKGGRNQEMALAYLLELAHHRELAGNLTFLAAATDGNDGPTDAAGAFADLEIHEKAIATELNPVSFLENNDSYHFFQACGGLLKTGPTNTNVCDLHLTLIDAEEESAPTDRVSAP
jgi:glycerate 2-kinase